VWEEKKKNKLESKYKSEGDNLSPLSSLLVVFRPKRERNGRWDIRDKDATLDFDTQCMRDVRSINCHVFHSYLGEKESGSVRYHIRGKLNDQENS